MISISQKMARRKSESESGIGLRAFGWALVSILVPDIGLDN